MLRRCILAAFAALFLTSTAFAQEESIRFEHMTIPMKQGFSTAKLSTYLYLPEGKGPFPLVVINHGKAPGFSQPDTTFKWQSKIFLARGYAVLVPNRAGLGESTGTYVSNCDTKYDARKWADSVEAAINYARKLPEIDATKIVIVGQSQGGITTVALGERNLPGVLGIVNFAGGSRIESCGGWESELIDSFKAYGKDSTVPAIFLYGDNDSFWGDGSLSKKFFEAYRAGNPNSAYVDEGIFDKGNSHMFFTKDGYPAWKSQLWQFFDHLGLSSQLIEADRTAVLAASSVSVFDKPTER